MKPRVWGATGATHRGRVGPQPAGPPAPAVAPRHPAVSPAHFASVFHSLNG